jgi:predicted deacylase
VGIPAVTFEAGAPARLETAEIAEAVAAIERLMHKQAMLEVPAEPDALSQGVLLVGAQAAAEPAPIFLDSRWVRANSGGLLISEVALGERVAAGQRLGRVIDPVSNVERFILAPVPGRVIGMAENQAVLPGYAAFHLGTETSEQQAVREAALPHAAEPVVEDPAYRRETTDAVLGEDFE